MKRFITPIILILIAIAVFFLLVDPGYKRVRETRVEGSKYDQALTKSKELQTIRDELLSKYNTFATTDLDDLKKMVPDHVDNVRLIIEIDNIASQYGMTVKDVALSQDVSGDETIMEARGRAKEEISLNFSVVSTYDLFISFLKDLEQSLRIVDIESVTFESSDVDLNEYFVKIKTYWLSSDE